MSTVGGFEVGKTTTGQSAGVGKEVVCIAQSLASSSSLSCRRWLFARFAIRWKGNGRLNSRSVNLRTREQATNVSPQANSFQRQSQLCPG